MTVEEFYTWACRPENEDRALELFRGSVVESYYPGRRQGFVCAQVSGLLGNWTRQHRGG